MAPFVTDLYFFLDEIDQELPVLDNSTGQY
jgi:hypothetical protein